MESLCKIIQHVVLDGKSLQENSVNARVPLGSILGSTLFLLYINDLPDNALLNIAAYAVDTMKPSYSGHPL